MKLRFRLFLFAFPVVLFGAEPGLEFSAYMKSSAGVRFVVTDVTTHKASDWLREGESFAGYTITGFDPKAELLTVRKADMAEKLPLKKEAVREGATVAPKPPVSSNYDLTLANDGSIPDREALKAQFRALLATAPAATIQLRIPNGAGRPDPRGAVRMAYEVAEEVGLKITGLRVLADPNLAPAPTK
jgi:hypothetical protein